MKTNMMFLENGTDDIIRHLSHTLSQETCTTLRDELAKTKLKLAEEKRASEQLETHLDLAAKDSSAAFEQTKAAWDEERSTKVSSSCAINPRTNPPSHLGPCPVR